MEMPEKSSANLPAEDQTLETAQKKEAANLASESETIETVGDDAVDPERAAEDEMTEALDEEENDEKVSEALSYETIGAVLAELEAKDPADISSDEIRRLRQQLNLLHKAYTDTQRALWVEHGNDLATFGETETQEEAELKNRLNALRERKAARAAEQEAERQANLERKNAIIAEIIALAEDTDNVNRTFPRYRELQDEFNQVGDVPAVDETSVWKRFQEARERYSDNLKINKELRDYDFKKNLDSKQLLLDEARKLVVEEDVIVAYRRLQELHNKWRRIGPVAKELREEIWDAFKNASTEINKRYQTYFEARKAREAENEAGKTAICERIEALDFSTLNSCAAWDEMTKTIMDAQAEWKNYGFASRKLNNQLFARFRAACDRFFTAKAEYFKATRDRLAANLARKVSLCERAEALQDSTDWRRATDELVALQKEWKTVGAVAKKYSDNVWKRFLAACDHFFEQKKQAGNSVRSVEAANLKAKRDLIAKLDLITVDTPRDEAVEMLRSIHQEWQQVGHVPYKEKDKVYDEYRRRLEKLRSDLDLNGAQARRERFKNAVAEIEGDENKLYRERERLTRALEAKRNELRTYENNLGFLSSKSKSGDSMLKEFERRADRLKEDIKDLEDKVKLIDSKL